MSEYVKPGEPELRKKLSPQQYEVTQHEGTEPPFQNEYWDEHREGILVAALCRQYELPFRAFPFSHWRPSVRNGWRDCNGHWRPFAVHIDVRGTPGGR